MDKAIKRGDLVYLNFDPIVGSEQGGPRPAVVVQNDMGNKHAPTVIIAPVTSKNKKAFGSRFVGSLQCRYIYIGRVNRRMPKSF